MATVEDWDKGSVALSHSASSKLLLGILGPVTVFSYSDVSENKSKSPAFRKLAFSKDKRNKLCSMVNCKCCLKPRNRARQELVRVHPPCHVSTPRSLPSVICIYISTGRRNRFS